MAKTIDKRVNVWLNGQGIENNLKSVRAAILKTTNELAKLPAYSEEWYQASQKLSKLKGIYAEMGKEIAATGDDLKNAAKENDNFILKLGSITSLWQTASGAVRRFVGATQEYVDAYAAMDDAMSAVQKTTGMTREEVENLNSQLKNIDTRTSQEELLKIAEIGGRLGLAKGDIEAFTESVNVANVALGDSFGGGAEEIASVLGKIRGAFQETKDADIGKAFQSIGSALNSVGATCAATEGNVAQFAQRLGALPDAMKPTIQDAIGLGAAFENASINAEVAATAYGQLMTKAASNLEAFAAAMGKPIEEVRELINTNPTEFMLQFAESFKGVPADQLGAKLKDLKLNAVGVQEAIGAMSGQTEKFREILSVSNQAFADGTSMMEEYSTVNNNAAAQLEKSKKRMQEVKVELGEKLIPIMTKLYEILSSGASWLTKNVKLVELVGEAIGAYILVVTLANARMKIHNAHLVLSNGYHKTHRAVVLASAAAQAAFEKDTVRANRALALSGKNLSGITGSFGKLGTAIKGVASKCARFVRFGPVAFLLGIAAAVVKVNRNVNEGKRAVEEISKASKERYASEIASIETEKVKIDQLREIINSENASRDKKLNAIQQLQNIIPGYVAELSEEGRVIKENTSAIDDYIKKMQERVQLNIFESQYQELEAKAQEIVDRKNERKEKDYSFFGHLHNVFWYDWDNPDGNSFSRSLSDIRKEQEKVLAKMKEIRVAMEPTDQTILPQGGNQSGETVHTGDPATCQCEACKAARDEARKKAEADRKKLLEDRKQFQKRLKDFNEAERIETLNEWEKTKDGIVKKYQEMIDEANRLYGKGNIYAQQLAVQLPQAITRAAEGYLKDYSDKISDFSDKTEKMLAEINKDDQNEFISKILGTQQEWDEHISMAQENVATLKTIMDSMEPGDPDRPLFETLIRQNIDEITNAEFGKQQAELAVIGMYINKYTQLVNDAEDDVLMNTMTDSEKKQYLWEKEKEAKKKAYEAQIGIAEKMLEVQKVLNSGDEESVRKIENLIKRLQDLKSKVDEMEMPDDGSNNEKQSHSGILAFLDISKKDPWEKNLERATESLRELQSVAFDVYNSIAERQRNAAEVEMNTFAEAQNKKTKTLQQQLNDGLISQKYYDAQLEKMEEEKEKKEREINHEQFEREKRSNLIKAVIEGALAASTSFTNGGGFPWGLIPMALSLAVTGAQISTIASQVNPYARGGFINQKQIALMGEEGREWIASNTLLTDKKTAPIIAALEEYQRGNKNALQLFAPKPNWNYLSQSANRISSNFASEKTQVVNNYYTSEKENSELLSEIKRMNQFLSDPKNRQAYISYKIQTETTANREFIKKASAL